MFLPLAFAAILAATPSPRRVTVELSALTDAGHDDFHDFWSPGASGELAVFVPLSRGFVEVAAQPFSSAPSQTGLPRIRSLVTSLGWGASLTFPARLRLRVGARAAVVWMLFDATADREEQDENELAFGARASLERSFASHWSAELGVRALRMQTHRPIDWVFAGGGLAYSFAMPRWLAGFLE